MLCVGYDVDVVEYAHRLSERLHLYRAEVQSVVELDPFRLDLVEALVRRETGEQVNGSALELLHGLLKILASVGALRRSRGSRDVENLSFWWYRICAGCCCRLLY